jgi:3-dehydroquinate synthase
MATIAVNASKTYDIIIGTGLLDEAGSLIRKVSGGQAAAIVTDDNVAALYGKRLKDSLEKSAYRVAQYVFSPGEAAKNVETYLSLIDFLAAQKLSRGDLVVALGGGVAGDLAGFAAATYLRGIRLIQIPTTLLAAVDSSVGGKTAVNLSAGKNLLGAFYQPDLVLSDVSLLSTLQSEVLRDGWAEVIKYAVIAGGQLFESLTMPGNTQLEAIIARCVEIKRDIVAEDEFEKGKRKLLNLGHTIGHAIELLSEYRTSHGQAVAAGMAVVTRAAACMGICEAGFPEDLLRMLRRYGLPESTPYTAAQLASACLSDKKREGDFLTMVFPLKIGECLLKKIPVNELESVISLGI